MVQLLMVCLAVQVLLADRLIEARSEALNGHVFSAATNERLTNLCKEPDLLPLQRRERTCMSDGIIHGSFSQDAAPPPSSHVSTRDTADASLPPAPLCSLSSMRERTASLRNDSFRSVCVNSVSGRHLEDTPACSPRIGAGIAKGTQPDGASKMHCQRQMYFGRDKGPSRVSGFW